MAEKQTLEFLSNASALLVSSFDTKEILPKGMEIIKQLLNCQAASIMLIDDEGKNLVFEVALGEKGKELEQIAIPLGKGIAGEVALHEKAQIVNDVSAHPGFDPSFDKKTGFKTKSILCVPLKFNQSIIGVAQAINPQEKTDFTDHDLFTLSLFADQVALVVQGAKLHKKILAQQSLEQELQFARTIQESFLPQKLPQVNGFSFYGATLPARTVSGDFYDFFPLDNDHTAFVIGDVSGKGMGAALMMAKTLSELKTIAQKQHDSYDPGKVLLELNLSLCSRRISNMFTTMIYGIIAHGSGKAIIASAGHPYPLLCTDNDWSSISLNNGLPVGISIKASYQNLELTLGDGALLLLYTDALTETLDSNGKNFIAGLPEFTSRLQRDAMETGIQILEGFKIFTRKTGVLDDATFILIKRSDQPRK